MSENEFLSDKERSLVLFIEKFHAISGVPPEEFSMIDYLHSLGYNTSETEIKEIFNNPLFIRSMEVRGIVLGKIRENGGLTPRQMAVAAAMANYVDRRSDEKKLRDMGVSSAEYSTWLLDNNYVNYLAGRVERLVGNTTHEAHLGLIRGVRNGNVQAIKLHYELTGRYNPDKEEAVNLRTVLAKFIEVIQKNVKDPTVMAAIGAELQQIAIEATLTSSNTIQGSAVAKRDI